MVLHERNRKKFCLFDDLEKNFKVSFPIKQDWFAVLIRKC